MICADTSSIVAYIQGEQGQDVDLVDRALDDRSLVLAPVTITELLSNPDLTPALEKFVLGIPQMEVKPRYWERAGKLRARLLRRRIRPKMADSLIAQSCLDHDVGLVTRDLGFSAFQKLAGLRLLSSESWLQ